jgi:hypothetical protein
MKALEILLRLIDKFLLALQNKKNQEAMDELEANPAEWFNSHFDGMPTMSNDDKTKQTHLEGK